MAFDINSLLEQAIDAQAQGDVQLGGIAEQLTANTAALKEANTISAEKTAEAADAAAGAARQTAAVDYTQRMLRESNQRMLGIDPGQAENALQISINQLHQAEARYQQNRQRYDRLTSQSLLDNPIGYILAQLEMPSAAAKVNAAAMDAEAAENNIKTRVDIQQRLNTTVTANVAESLREADLKRAEASALLAQGQLAEKKAMASSREAGAAMQMGSLINMRTDNAMKIFNMQISAANAATSKAQWDMLKEERYLKLKGEREGRDQITAGLQTAANFLGYQEAPTAEMLSRMGKKEQDAWSSVAIMGSFGGDLSISLPTFAAMRPSPNFKQLNPGVATFVEKLAKDIPRYVSAIEKEQLLGKGPKLKANEVAPEALREYQRELTNSASTPNYPKSLSSDAWDTTFNPYHAQHKVILDEVLSGGGPAQLRGNLYIAALSTVAGTTGAKDGENLSVANEQRALAVLRDQVANRTLDPKDAARAVSDYYRYAAAKNVEMYQYGNFGLPVQEQYNFTMKPAGMASPALPADLMNPVSVERALLRDVRGMAAIRDTGFGRILTELTTGVPTEQLNAQIQREREAAGKK